MKTTPKEIQAALDALRRYSERMARYKSYAPREYGSDGYGDYKIVHDFIQSHAPEARPVDAEALKKGNHNVNNPLYRDYNIGWNACIDYLLRRGFRQGGGS